LLTKINGVCVLHFVSEGIILFRVVEDTAGNEIQYKLKKVILNQNAIPIPIPCIFSKLLSSFNRSIKKGRLTTKKSTSPNNFKKNKPSDINVRHYTIQ